MENTRTSCACGCGGLIYIRTDGSIGKPVVTTRAIDEHGMERLYLFTCALCKRIFEEQRAQHKGMRSDPVVRLTVA